MKNEGQWAKDALRSRPAEGVVGLEWWWVYRIQSIQTPSMGYTGLTQNLKRRLDQHNRKENPSTAPYAPYHITFFCAFPDKGTALSFESYLKTGSGKAFAKKRLWPGQISQSTSSISEPKGSWQAI